MPMRMISMRNRHKDHADAGFPQSAEPCRRFRGRAVLQFALCHTGQTQGYYMRMAYSII